MPTTAVYDEIMAELAGGQLQELERQILRALSDNPKGLDRRSLVQLLFGYTPADLAGDTNDRKIRTAIAGLRERLIPVVSSSGEAGYRLDRSPEALKTLRDELIHRRDKLNAKIDQVTHAIHNRPWKSEEQPHQMGMFGGQ